RTNLSKEEHDKLNETIEALAILLPTAVSEWDEYGRAIDISRSKVENLTKAQRELFNQREAGNIKEATKQFEESMRLAGAWEKQRDKSRAFLDSGKIDPETELYQIHADRLAGASSKQLLELGNA